MAKVGVGRGTMGARHRHGVRPLVPVAASGGGGAIGGLSLLLENEQGILLEQGYDLLLEKAGATVGYSLFLESGEALNTELSAPLLLEL